MKKPSVKFTQTKSKTARLKLAFEIQYDSRDAEARDQAWRLLAKVVAEILPTTEQREEFLQELRAAMKHVGAGAQA